VHKSKLAGFIIDCQTEDLPAAAEFWSRALGLPTRQLGAGEEAYVGLDAAPLGLHVEVQRVDHESRVHLDIETDDIEAEVARLEALGARRVEQTKSWWVMQAPTGQHFCVVRATSPRFEASANPWD
jgi:predicted enzyme related to lactoylglutathione lyase